MEINVTAGAGPVSVIDLGDLDGGNGFKVIGGDTGDNAGGAVGGGGDVNGDGLDDIVVGASSADPNGASSGQAYLVFGDTSLVALHNLALSTLNGSNGGYALNGGVMGDAAGRAVAVVRDMNGDGLAEVAIGAPGVDGGHVDTGQSYLVMGRSSGFPALSGTALPALVAPSGFVFTDNTNMFGASSGGALSGAGDVDGDGYMDLIVGAIGGAPGGTASGQVYLSSSHRHPGRSS